MVFIELGYLGLFIGTFLSATLIPFPSDVMLLGVYKAGMPIVPALAIATVGNVLGGLTNYWIGYKGSQLKLEKRFKLNPEKLAVWDKRAHKYGVFLGLFSWMPFVGDPMLAALGFFRVRFWPLLLMIFIGKFGRYIVLTWIYLQF